MITFLPHTVGDRSSQPILLQKSADGCHFELVWYTAAACAVGRLYGDNCQVYYPVMGNHSHPLLLSSAFVSVHVKGPIDC